MMPEEILEEAFPKAGGLGHQNCATARRFMNLNNDLIRVQSVGFGNHYKVGEPIQDKVDRLQVVL